MQLCLAFSLCQLGNPALHVPLGGRDNWIHCQGYLKAVRAFSGIGQATSKQQHQTASSAAAASTAGAASIMVLYYVQLPSWRHQTNLGLATLASLFVITPDTSTALLMQCATWEWQPIPGKKKGGPIGCCCCCCNNTMQDKSFSTVSLHVVRVCETYARLRTYVYCMFASCRGPK